MSQKLIPTCSNSLVSVLISLRCSAMLPLSAIFIKKTLFDVEDFSYIFDRTAIKSWFVFSLEMLNATVNVKNNQIAPRTF